MTINKLILLLKNKLCNITVAPYYGRYFKVNLIKALSAARVEFRVIKKLLI